jgi:hypothetical protein
MSCTAILVGFFFELWLNILIACMPNFQSINV